MSEGEGSSVNVKVWIGNIDTKLDEYQLLKIVEKFGRVCSFDFLYHINDRGGRTPRGYAFVTFQSGKSAADAIQHLHKKKILTKELLVRYASSKTDYSQRIADKPIPAALTAGKSSQLSAAEKQRKIRELEAKLKTMQKSGSEEFKVNTGPRIKPY